MVVTNIFFIFLFGLLCCFTTGYLIGNQCFVYSSFDAIQWNDGKDRICVSYQGEAVCKEWECPVPSCDEPISGEYGTCKSYCEGNCTYGGTEHEIGVGFVSPDGSNTCWCSEWNTYFCSYGQFTVQTMCNLN
ncbi:Hypothetical predicted protein [Mytilus galloprovincialis]|uniref:Uncharacterized protein n=1 Tax=Mytilus galloprovincialis TaxID=29158 RepID=A0A8B6E6H9_MYTGA|nr:Hypothetical predicted protein [Mytilus galloprovincialis]